MEDLLDPADNLLAVVNRRSEILGPAHASDRHRLIDIQAIRTE